MRDGRTGETSKPYHDFREQLEFSQEQADWPFWDAAYRGAFPDFASRVSVVNNMDYQRKGVDSIISLSTGRKLYADEKMRRSAYPDILLEYNNTYHTGEREFPGWIEKPLVIDFLAYGIRPTNMCYVIPWQPLRRAWRQYRDEWETRITPVMARNKEYTTWSLPIPIGELMDAVLGAMVVKVEGETL